MPVGIGVAVSPVFSYYTYIPNAPTNLTVVQNGADVDLSWTDNADNEDGYKIYRSTDGITFVEIDDIAPDSTSYTDVNPGSGIWYYYVAAYNDNGEADSNTISLMLYLLLDEFTTNEAAPITLPRTCEPGPGTLTGAQTSGTMTIVGQLLRTTGANSTTAPRIQTGAISRVTGRAFAVAAVAGTANRVIGYDATATLTWDVDYHWRPDGRFRLWTSPATDANALGGDYLGESPILIMRPTGLILVRGGGVVEYIGNIGSEATLYAGMIHFGVGDGDQDDWRIADLPTPWDTDYGIATNRIATTSNGSTTTSEADAIIEHTITAATGVTQELTVRRVDNDNRIIIRMDQAAGTIKVIERAAAVETELLGGTGTQTWTNGVSYRIVVIMEGTQYRVFVADVAKNITSSTFNQAAIGVQVSHAGTNLVAWPRQLSGVALSTINFL